VICDFRISKGESEQKKEKKKKKEKKIIENDTLVYTISHSVYLFTPRHLRSFILSLTPPPPPPYNIT
jgi:hypothetical protein